MLMWYKVTANFYADIDDKRTKVSEEYAFHGVTYGDVEKTALEALQDRIKENDLDISKLRGLTDVYIKASSEDWTQFYLVTVIVDGVDKKRTEKHLLNASSTRNADERVRATYKGSQASFKIKKVEELKILGLYDKLRQDLVDDFRNRQDYLGDHGYVEAERVESTIFNKDGSAKYPNSDQPQSDPNAITAMVIHNGIVAVEAEDLNNGQHDDADHLERVRELPAGNTRLLDEPADVAA
ncbi:hypothetical protein GCM10028818_40750 [Spirosoma horti]